MGIKTLWLEEGKTGVELFEAIRRSGKIAKKKNKKNIIRFVADGFQVVFCAPKSEQESGDRLVSELKGNADFIACDVSRAEEVEAMIAQIKQKHGRLHVIFNNAGVGASDGRLHEIPNDRFQLLTNVNQIGAFYVMK